MYLHHFIANRDHGGHISAIDLPSSTSLCEAQEAICDRDPRLRQYHLYWLQTPRSSFDKEILWCRAELQRQNVAFQDESVELLEQSLDYVYGERSGICLIFLPEMKTQVTATTRPQKNSYAPKKPPKSYLSSIKALFRSDTTTNTTYNESSPSFTMSAQPSQPPSSQSSGVRRRNKNEMAHRNYDTDLLLSF